MKAHIRTIVAACALLAGGTSLNILCAAEFDVRPARLDGEGRFWLYKDATTNTPLPFVPYGVMPKEAGENSLLTMNVACTDNPYLPEKASDGSLKPTCFSVKVKWADPFWCGVAWIAATPGSDQPPRQFWGEDERGKYYDLSGLKHKRLVFYARGARGSERIQVKVGILGSKPYGDSMPFPAETRWLKLSMKWQRFELDLSKFKPEQLKRICNGFCFVLNQDENDGAPETSFFLDCIYFE